MDLFGLTEPYPGDVYRLPDGTEVRYRLRSTWTGVEQLDDHITRHRTGAGWGPDAWAMTLGLAIEEIVLDDEASLAQIGARIAFVHHTVTESWATESWAGRPGDLQD